MQPGDSSSGEGFTNLLPMMEGMMQSLLSKELLYQPMKDIAEKFPDWLADNRNKVSDEEFVKYNKQFELTKKICFLYEEEASSDTAEVKKKRFDLVMELMQKMQGILLQTKVHEDFTDLLLVESAY